MYYEMGEGVLTRGLRWKGGGLKRQFINYSFKLGNWGESPTSMCPVCLIGKG